MNLLILSAGTRDKVVQYFKQNMQPEDRVIATDCSNVAPAVYEADVFYLVPRMTAPGYIEKILEICEKEHVDGVFSLIDPELSLLAKERDRFLAIGTTPIVSSYELCEMCLDKFRMYQKLCEMQIPTGKCFVDKELFKAAVAKGEITFPVFVKPARGSASININKVNSMKEIDLLFELYDGLMIQEFMDDFLGLYISPKNRLMNSLLIAPGLPGGMMGSLMADLETNLESINKYKAKRNLPFMTQDELLIKLFNEVAYVWPRVGYPPLVTPFSQYVKNLAMMNVMAMEKGKERWGMIADDIWDMILGKAGRLPGKLAPEIIEKAEREGRKFFDGNPQDNYPDQLEKYRKMMLEKQWDKGQDDEELFEYAMHPAQYEAYKSGKAKEDFLADVKKRREEKANATTPVEAENKTKVLTVDVNGQPYRVTVAYGAVDPATLTAASGAVPAQTAPAPVGEGKDVLSPLEGKFFLVKNAQETPKKVGEKVNKGDVICYVEAMKTYNAIRAEYDGTITAICANSGDTVSEDDVLMKIV